jgi:hypothetical protein
MRLEGMAAKEPSAAEPQPKGIENAEAAETQRSRARHEIYAACGNFPGYFRAFMAKEEN